MSPLETDVAIIGGGLMGSWTALFLRQRGRSVAVVERGFAGAQASGVNLGSLRLQGQSPLELPLCLRAHALWERLPELIGDDGEFHQTGHLRLALEEEHLPTIAAGAETARPFGVDIQFLDKGDVRRRYPWLDGSVLGATFSARDAGANPRLVAPAVSRAAKARGADLREGENVVRIDHANDRFTVATESGLQVRAPILLNAAGAWADKISARFGEEVPLFGAAPVEQVTEPLPMFIEPTLQVADNRFVLRQVKRGNLLIGGQPRGSVDAKREKAIVEPVNVLRNGRRVLSAICGLKSVHIIRTWSGVEGYLPDMRPVLGPSLTTPGLYHAFGFSGHGFQLSPAIGDIMATLIAEGESPEPLDRFRPDRFATEEGLDSAAMALAFDTATIQKSETAGA